MSGRLKRAQDLFLENNLAVYTYCNSRKINLCTLNFMNSLY